MSSNLTDILIILQLQHVSRDLSLTIGFIILIGGNIGNLLNIFVFIVSGSYKHNASSLYAMVRSFFDVFVLCFGLGTRILRFGFQIDPTKTNQFWCKFRVAVIYVTSLVSLTCLCLQSIDAFFCSSRFVVYRRMSNVRMARYSIIISVFIWAIHEVPYIYFQQLVNVAGAFTCLTTNTTYAWYHNYFVTLGFWTVIPIAIITVFGFLIYAHLHDRHALLDLTRQITRMTLFNSASVFIFQIPSGISQAYFISTAHINRDAYHSAQGQVIQLFFSSYGYGTYASSFYCYYVASNRFRNDFINALKQLLLFWRPNQVLPERQVSRVSQEQPSHL